MKRWPLIRHLRYLYWAFRFQWWWSHQGRFLGAVPNEKDLQHLFDIRDGRA